MTLLTSPIRIEVSPDGTQATVSTTSRTPKTVRLRLHGEDNYHPPTGGRTITRETPWTFGLDPDKPDQRPTVQVLGGGWADVGPL